VAILARLPAFTAAVGCPVGAAHAMALKPQPTN
jgi:hypothetical protein